MRTDFVCRCSYVMPDRIPHHESGIHEKGIIICPKCNRVWEYDTITNIVTELNQYKGGN